MDDPNQRPPPGPPPPDGAYGGYPLPAQPPPPGYAPYPMPPPPPPQMMAYPPPMQPGVHIAGLPGMPGIVTGGGPGGAQVTVISNVVGQPYPQQPHAGYGGQPYAQPGAPYPLAPMQAQAQPGAAQGRGALAMMRDDAAQKTMEAVARGGPARMLGFGVGGVSVAAMVVAVLLVPFAGAPAAVLLAMIPLGLIALLAFWLGARAGRGLSSHHLEQAILRVASEQGGVIRVVALAQATGRPLRECQVAIDAMVASGHATVDADEAGNLVYRIPDLEPRKAKVVYDATVTG